MSGICGLVNFEGVNNTTKQDIKLMLNTLEHRGPDRSEIFYDQNVILGNNFLKLTTKNDRIPKDENGRCIVYDGIIFNKKELQQELNMDLEKDSEIILELYKKKTSDFLNYLDGEFSFALWDPIKKKIILARDRLGVKPLYYIKKDKKIIFASELKAILNLKFIQRKINLESLYTFINFKYYLNEPKTIIQNIKNLEPGKYIEATKEHFKLASYWDIRFSKIKKYKDFYTIYSKEFQEAIKKRIIEEEPLTIALSGGVDSSAIVAMAKELTSNTIKTFSCGWDIKGFEDYNELKYAKIIAEKFETEHYEKILDDRHLNLLPSLVWNQDYLSAASSSIMQIALSQEIKNKKCNHLFTGDGADEIFCGKKNGIIIASEFLRKNQTDKLINYTPTFCNKIEKAKDLLKSKSLAEMYWTFDAHKSLLLSKDQYSSVFKKSHEYYPKILHNLTDESWSDYQKLSYWDFKVMLPGFSLNKVERDYIACSVNTTMPCSDYKLIEISANTPLRYKWNGITNKLILVKLMKNRLPKSIISRKKQGTRAPLLELINSNKDIFFSLIESFKKRKYVQENPLNKLMKTITKESAEKIWVLSVLELWHKIFIEEKTNFAKIKKIEYYLI